MLFPLPKRKAEKKQGNVGNASGHISSEPGSANLLATRSAPTLALLRCALSPGVCPQHRMDFNYEEHVEVQLLCLCWLGSCRRSAAPVKQLAGPLQHGAGRHGSRPARSPVWLPGQGAVSYTGCFPAATESFILPCRLPCAK